MYNYEIEEAEIEFMKDDEGVLWLLNILWAKVNLKEGYEESVALNGITYWHPKGKDPELENTHFGSQFDPERWQTLEDTYTGKFEEDNNEKEEIQLNSKQK